MRILVVDDESVALSSVKRLLRRRGYKDVAVCDSGKKAVEHLRTEEVDVVLLDLLMPDMDGLAVIEATKPLTPLTEFIMITAIEDVPTSVKAIRLGAYDYLVKPVDPERLHLSILRAFERRSLRVGRFLDAANDAGWHVPEAFAGIITQDPRMRETMRTLQMVAHSSLPVLITGESGTGKELFARGIHRCGGTAESPFVPVNVAAVPDTLFESQFFGHQAGAFTGATGKHAGFFEQADTGVLYLDEVSEIPVSLQAKFLRALEDRIITRLGDNTARPVDIRLVSSTNTDLNAACREGRFRLDLYYRLNAVQVHLPPLRERPGDIPLLVDHFVKLASHRYDKAVLGCDPGVKEALKGHVFQGNVRELRWMVEKAVLICQDDHLSMRHFDMSSVTGPPPAESRPLCTLKENAESHVAFVMDHCRHDTARAADILGVTPRQVQRRLADMRDNPDWGHWFEKAGEGKKP